MTEAKVNYNFEESYVHVQQVKITNNLGRTVLHKELVTFDGFTGEVLGMDGILNGATGFINIYPFRHIGTTQINVTDTFVVGQVVHLTTHATIASSVIRATPEVDTVPLGICTVEDSGTSITFMPFVQNSGGANDLKVSVYNVDSDASTAIVVTGLVPLGAKIVDVIVECTATVGSGTLQLQSTAPVNITAALVCATDNVVIRQAILTNDVVDADGLQIEANGASDRGIMTIYWR